MASTLRVKITHTDGAEATLDVRPATIVAFERHFSVGISALSTEGRMEWIYFLAYDAEKRSGAVVPPTFDAWVETLDAVDVEDESAPLDQGSTPASSPASQ